MRVRHLSRDIMRKLQTVEGGIFTLGSKLPDGAFWVGALQRLFFLEMKGFSRRTSFFFRGKQWESRLVIFE